MRTRSLSSSTAMAVLTAASVVVAGCGSDTAAEGPDADGLTAITVAVSPGAATSTPLYLAQSSGVFERAGLKVDFTVVEDGSVAIPNTLNGQTQFSMSGFGPAVQAIERGVDISIIGAANIVPTDPESRYQAIVVNAESGIADITQVRTWAADSTEVDPSQAFAVDALGGDYESLQRVAVPFPAIGDAVADGSVDAALLNEPFLSAAMDTGKVRILSYVNGERAVTGSPGAVFIGANRYISENPAITASFIRAVQEAYSYAADHRDEVAQYIPQTGLGTTVPPVAALGEYQRGPLDPVAVQALLDVFQRYGAIEGAMSAQDMIYTP